jgi:hypothetical protein
MKKHLLIAFLSCVLVVNSGCATYVAKKQWNTAQEAQAVRVEADGNQVMIGVDLTAMNYFKDNWPVAIGAGVVDALLLYGTYELADELSSNGSSRGGPSSDGGRDATSITVNGDGNTVQVRGDESNFPSSN